MLLFTVRLFLIQKDISFYQAKGTSAIESEESPSRKNQIAKEVDDIPFDAFCSKGWCGRRMDSYFLVRKSICKNMKKRIDVIVLSVQQKHPCCWRVYASFLDRLIGALLTG